MHARAEAVVCDCLNGPRRYRGSEGRSDAALVMYAAARRGVGRATARGVGGSLAWLIASATLHATAQLGTAVAEFTDQNWESRLCSGFSTIPTALSAVAATKGPLRLLGGTAHLCASSSGRLAGLAVVDTRIAAPRPLGPVPVVYDIGALTWHRSAGSSSCACRTPC